MIKKQEYVEGVVIEKLPEIKASEGKLVKWFYPTLNVIVTPPYRVVQGVTFEAREFNEREVSLYGIQVSEKNAEGNISMRLLGAIHTLKADEAGFEMRANYVDREGHVIDRNMVKTCSTVYHSVAASDDGACEAKTAAELGGTYVIAVSVDDIPVDTCQIDFFIRAYVVINGEKIYSSDEPVRFAPWLIARARSLNV